MNKENNFKDSYPEELFEMASVRSNNTEEYYDRLTAVNPDIDHNGNPYFKYYKNNSYGNKSGNKVARISFLKAEYIIHKKESCGIPTWNDPYPNSNDKQRLIDILKSPSEENPNYTVWTMLKYHWNSEKGFRGSLEDYASSPSIMDMKYMNPNSKGNYIPYSLQMPDYMDL